MWDLPRPGIEPVSPALAGGFLTTVPQGKSQGKAYSNTKTYPYAYIHPQEIFGKLVKLAVYAHIEKKSTKNPGMTFSIENHSGDSNSLLRALLP